VSGRNEIRILDVERVATVKSAPLVYGDGAALDDPSEAYHEASKLYPSYAGRQTRGYLLERRADLRQSSGRPGKRYRGHTVALPEPSLPQASFAALVEERSSCRAFSSDAVSLEALAAILHAGYGVTHQLDPERPPGTPPLLRSVPSGGALYPLELYVLALAVDGLAAGVYHFEALRRQLVRLRAEPALRGVVADASVYPDAAAGGAFLLVIAASFWRSRFKYGARAYRFTLLEAGHVAQNVLLAAAALGLGSVALGGFFDRLLDRLLGLDGVNESALYCVAVGHGAEAA
jgi:SagB-type dehydrogenase family enzyme